MSGISPSVLIIRLDGIGDAVALTPLIAALRKREIPVDVVLGERNAAVFSQAALRHAIVSDVRLRSSARSNLEAIALLGRALAANSYSHVLTATEDPAGYRLAGAVGAPVRMGFASSRGKPLKNLWLRRFLTSIVYRTAGLDPRAPHECEVLFELGRPLVGEEPPSRDPAKLRPMLLDAAPKTDGRVAVQITDKWERLGIAFDSVVAMLRRLAASTELRLLAPSSERNYAERIVRETGTLVESFGSMGPWKNALAAATAVVTPDCGALHIAGMIGTPVVAVFPPSPSYRLQVARWSPWASPYRIVGARDEWPILAQRAVAELLSR